MCLFAVLAGLFPRVAFGIFWIARPGIVDAVYGNFIVPFLGLLFLPFTTLMYTILWNPGTGVSGTDWIWVGIAFILDLTHYGASAVGNRERIPGYSGD